MKNWIWRSSGCLALAALWLNVSEITRAEAAEETESAPAETKGPPADAKAPPTVPHGDATAPEAPKVELMPAEAFWPEPYLRGLVGGSVWLNPVHGLQWPYYRKTGIGISGDAWIDNAYESIDRGDPNEAKEKSWIQQGRFVLRVTPTYTRGNMFVQAQAELVANKDQTLKQPDVADTDDLWVAVGAWNKWDLRFGRFQGWEVYHLGMGLDLNTFERRGATDINNPPPDIYGVTNGYYRPSGVGNAAMHLYLTDYLRFEIMGQVGSELGTNALGGRGVAVLDFGWLKLKGGAEYKKQTQVDPNLPQTTDPRGYGGGVIFVFRPYIEFGFSVAQELVDRTDEKGNIDTAGSFTVTSMGGFANLRPFANTALNDLLIGAGLHRTEKTDLHHNSDTGEVGHFTHVQMFGAIQYPIMNQLYVKLVVAKADADIAPSFGNPAYSNSMLSARLRFFYMF